MLSLQTITPELPRHTPLVSATALRPFFGAMLFFGFQRGTYFYRRERDVLLIVKLVA